MKNYRLWVSMTAIVAVVCVVLAFVAWSSRDQAKNGHFTLKSDKFSMDMQLENSELSFEKMIAQIFSNHDRQVEAKALMADKYSLYALDDADLAGALERLSPQARLAGELRGMASKHKGPWKRELVRVRLSFPPNLDVLDDRCVVCDGSDWYGRKLVLWDKTETFSTNVFAGNPRACQAQDIDPSTGPENIQITMATARKLFGGRPLNKFEEGWVGFAD